MKRENPTHPMDEMSAELTRLRSEVRRLRGWLRYLKGDWYAPWVESAIDDAMRGKPAPRRGR